MTHLIRIKDTVASEPGWYRTAPGIPEDYTQHVLRARRYSSREEAEQVCSADEEVVALYTIIGGTP